MSRETPTSLPILQPLPLDFDDDDDDDNNVDSDHEHGHMDHQRTLTDIHSTTLVREEYLPRTLGEHNIQRLSILPIYPPFSPATPATTTPRKPHLLLSNVPSN